MAEGGKYGGKGLDRFAPRVPGEAAASPEAQPSVGMAEGGKYGGKGFDRFASRVPGEAAASPEAQPSIAQQDSSSFRRAPSGPKGGGGGGMAEGGQYGGGREPGGKGVAASLIAAPRIRVGFCPDPQTQGQRFTATYDPSPPVNFASLNAGDGKLFVGGGGQNRQFEKDLEGSAAQVPREYMELHTRLFEAATPGELFEAPPALLGGNSNVIAAYVLVPPSRSRVGIVFIDVFQPTKRPHGHEKNVAMIYTVGPKRQDCPDDGTFVAALTSLASNVALACSQYNQRVAEPKLEKVRIGLVSGGDFAGQVPKFDVASALCMGLKGGATEQAPIFEFAFDGNVFHQAWTRMHG